MHTQAARGEEEKSSCYNSSERKPSIYPSAKETPHHSTIAHRLANSILLIHSRGSI